MSSAHSRIAIDYRYDGLIGFWFEGASLFSNNDLYNLATIGADYTLPIYNGVLIMAETMQINGGPKNSIIFGPKININETYSVLMASMPIGLLHQIMAIAQLDWERCNRESCKLGCSIGSSLQSRYPSKVEESDDDGQDDSNIDDDTEDDGNKKKEEMTNK